MFQSLRISGQIAVLAAATAAYLVRILQIRHNIVDDSYISFRFARHLATGHGLVWNVGGEPTEGYTNFLWVVLLAAAHAAGLDIETVAPTVMVLVTFGTVALLLWTLHRHLEGFTTLGVAVVAVYLADPFTAVHTISGLETLLAVFFVTASIVAVLELHTRPSLPAAISAGVAFALAVLTRPDMALFAGALTVSLLAGWRHITMRYLAAALGVAAAITGAYAIWKAQYFGYLLPNPFYVKTPGSIFALAGLRQILRYFDHLTRETWPLWAPILALLLYRARTLGPAWQDVKGRFAKRETQAMAAALLLPPAMGLSYYLTIIHEVGFASRFSFPTYPFFVLTGAVFATWLARRRAVISTSAERAIVVLVIVVIVGRVNWRFEAEPPAFPAALHEPFARALAMSGLGPKVGLHFMAAGLIPYRSDVNHVDPVGLVDNELCGRVPLSRDEYERTLWSRPVDVYLGPEPPATEGAEHPDADPAMKAGYVPHLIGEVDPAYALSWRHPRFGPIDFDGRAEFLHRRMRRLRDEWLWLGEHRSAPLWNRLQFRLMIYVRRDSPYREQLVAALAPLADVTPDRVDVSAAVPSWLDMVDR